MMEMKTVRKVEKEVHLAAACLVVTKAAYPAGNATLKPTNAFTPKNMKMAYREFSRTSCKNLTTHL